MLNGTKRQGSHQSKGRHDCRAAVGITGRKCSNESMSSSRFCRAHRHHGLALLTGTLTEKCTVLEDLAAVWATSPTYPNSRKARRSFRKSWVVEEACHDKPAVFWRRLFACSASLR